MTGPGPRPAEAQPAAAGPGLTAPRQGGPAGWRPTPALVRVVGVVAAALLAAVLLRRADLVLLAAPLAIGSAVALAGRSRGVPEVRLGLPSTTVLEGGHLEPVATLGATEPVDLVTLELPGGRWLVADGAPASRALPLQAGVPVEVAFRFRSDRWGRRAVGPAVVRAVTAYGLLRCGPYPSRSWLVTTWPLREGFVAVDAMPGAEGLVGQHRSRRPGEGTDIAGVRPFAPGDRLRRVNWRVTQRTDRLHVTNTYSDRDAEVLLCLDSRRDLGQPPASSLDTGVRAAAAIAEHYLRHGDRVGLVDLGRSSRRVRAGNGRAHLVRLLDVLLDARAVVRSDTGDRTADMFEATDLLRIAPPRALVVVLTPLAAESTFTLLAALGHGGSSVVVVDTLPPTARPDRRSPWTDLAYRLWSLERAVGIGRLGELGVPVVPWRGSGSLDQVLRDVSRAARAPRLLR